MIAGLRVTPGAHTPPLLKAWLATEIVVAYAITRWRLPRRNIGELTRELRARGPARGHQPQPDSPETLLTARRLANAMNRTLRVLPTDARCLVQSVLLTSLLSARGITNTLVIGVHSEDEFAAHAWVEHGGRALLPTNGFEDSRLLSI